MKRMQIRTNEETFRISVDYVEIYKVVHVSFRFDSFSFKLISINIFLQSDICIISVTYIRAKIDSFSHCLA